MTVGSDAHRAPSFAYRLDDAYEAAAAAGYRALAFRRGAGPVTVAIPERFVLDGGAAVAGTPRGRPGALG